MDDVKIINATMDDILQYGVCGYKNMKKPGYPEKIQWIERYSQRGLKFKFLISKKNEMQGMIEYVPGEYCFRPVQAKGYLFIHCIFLGFKKIYKGRGLGTQLLHDCIQDAKKEKMQGLSVVTRNGAFMARKELFIKNGFEKVDQAGSDFELLVKKFNKNAPHPQFKNGLDEKKKEYKKGLTILRSDQCPYTVKNVNEIIETARDEYGITAKIVNLNDHEEAQESPCAFGSFCLLFNGRILAEHPISRKRFMNIMKKQS